MLRAVLFTGLVVGLVALPAAGQVCNEEVTAGNFDIVFEGATYDGTNTQFEYCVTNTGGQSLSHWVLDLDVACINPEDLVDCGPQPCFYQVNDPTTGVTGIKWDDTSVETGETECFDFTLAGDWTASIDDVTIAMKAGQSEYYGEICGPICVNCEAAVELIQDGGQLMMGVAVRHNRPPTVTRVIEYAIVSPKRDITHRWQTGPITFNYGTSYEYYGPIPMPSKPLPPGEYVLVMRLDGMSGWHWKTRPFFIK